MIRDLFLDTEFLDTGSRLELISIGVVDLQGREFYAENSEFDWEDPEVSDWLRKNVRPHLRGGDFQMDRGEIAWGLRRWVRSLGAISRPRFWSWFAAHDWVLVCNLFGGLMSLPGEWPQVCLDLEQLRSTFGLNRPDREPDGAEHDALADARWHREIYREFMRVIG